MPPVPRPSITFWLPVLIVVLALAGCRGDNPSAAAPSDVPDTQDSAGPLAKGRYDCVPSSEGDGWECSESE
ncbi:MAG: hypothetical protein OXF31_01040 [Gammaproteobacteria bacterium]|nr:hypothetical protein [Gammaproteobacteria bacterium]